MRDKLREVINAWVVEHCVPVTAEQEAQLERAVYLTARPSPPPGSEKLRKWVVAMTRERCDAHDFVTTAMRQVDKMDVNYYTEKQVQWLIHLAYERGVSDGSKESGKEESPKENSEAPQQGDGNTADTEPSRRKRIYKPHGKGII